MIYLTMTLAVFAIELMHVNRKKYATVGLWITRRWDNIAVSLICGIALCIGFPEVAGMEQIKEIVDIREYPSIGGIIIGLSSTPLVNWIKKQTRDRISKKDK